MTSVPLRYINLPPSYGMYDDAVAEQPAAGLSRLWGRGLLGTPSPASSEEEAPMYASSYADDLNSAVHYALETTHAIAVCPFHLDLMIRIGDDAAESHALARARKLVKSDGTTWEGE